MVRGVMSFYLVKLDNGYFAPMYNKDKEQADKIEIGGEVSCKRARHGKFHRKCMSLLQLGYDNQEKYASFEVYRKIITIKAGFYHEVESKRGIEYFPQSISFENMSQEKFEKLFEAYLEVISEQLQTSPPEIKAALEGYY